MSESESNPDVEPLSRYVVGIDLGTTNCALSYVDTEADDWKVESFLIPQWVDFGQREQRETLPSFHYQLTADEVAADHGSLWPHDHRDHCVGVLARDAGHRHPGRRAASAKSWLSHAGVDRTADLLPWHGDADVKRLSPVDVSARYLEHLRAAWDQAHPDEPMFRQDVVITLPASFDEVARELTVTAAKKAGLPRVYLIEEPQAAFYAWIHREGADWQQSVRPGQLILVCDIGGGTTDLTLIRVRSAGDDGQQVQFHRVAVGDHLILGGDNLDLAVAKLAESKIVQDGNGQPLSPAQWDRLVQVSRSVKEAMLADDRPESYTVNLPSEGSRLVGGSVQIQLSADEIDRALMDGFFPTVDLTDKPVSGESGFQEFGLPYAADAAITRHLAEFLLRHRRTGLEPQDEDAADRPDLVLFNGGVMSSTAVQRRIVQLLCRWFGADTDSSATESDSSELLSDTSPVGNSSWQPRVLESPRLDLAVANGAAYYAMVRRGQGVRIAANLGRSYYLQVSSNPPQGLCLIPGSAEAGQRFTADEFPLQLKLGTPVQFPLWTSSTRLSDLAGQLVELDRGEAAPLPPICTALVKGKKRHQDETFRVMIEAELSEIGTVGIYCVALDSGGRWRLEFDIRSTLETDRDAHDAVGEAAGIIDSDTVAQCATAIESVFGDVPRDRLEKPGRLVKRLQCITGAHRSEWPPSLLRDQWQALLDHHEGRRRSPQHETRWLNLVGFCLRPGYGVAVDDWRVQQTWRSVHSKLAFPAAASLTESMILWRRIAGGLTTRQQTQLAAPWISVLKGKTRRIEPHEAAEVWRMTGSLERLPVGDKISLGKAALGALQQKKNEKIRHALLWAIGRIGSRQAVYGPLNATVPAERVSQWVDQLLSFASRGDFREHESMLSLSLVQLSRRTGDRFRDLPESRREQAAELLRSLDAPAHSIDLICDGGSLQSDEEAAIFGDSLPLGIHLAR